jgi:hypothetical protein
MSDDNTQDGAEPSPASAGSRGEPVAWGVFYGDGKLHSSWDSHAKAECTAVTMRRFDHLGVYVSPLYRSPTLTDEEREALEWAEVAAMVDAANETDADDVVAYERRTATLRVLRERLP